MIEQAGWILKRCEFIRGSDHFMAIFVRPEFLAQRTFGKERPAKKNRPPNQ